MSPSVSPNPKGHTSVDPQSQAGGRAGSSSSGGGQAAGGLPTEEAVRTWDSEDLVKWLTSIFFFFFCKSLLVFILRYMTRGCIPG